MTTRVVPASFRDPAGFVWTDGDTLYRQINEEYRPHYEHLISSGLYESLTSGGLLVPHEELDVKGPRPGSYKVIKPERVGFVSYPYEWCFGQLKDAALLTLEVQQVAMEHGMSLRDASAYNVLFHRGCPVLVDTLSFERYPEGKPWVAYRQFCQHFLAPLALMAHRDVRLGAILREYVDGVPLDLACRLLPYRSRLKPSLLLHLHMHARMVVRYEDRDVPERTSRRAIGKRAVASLVAGLRRAVRGLRWEPRRSGWREYYDVSDHYSTEAAARKKELVSELVVRTAPRTVWDLGANVGEYARLAASTGASTVCFDADPSCVEVNYRTVRAEGETNVLPLLCDLTNPSPALGWSHRERMSLTQRGPADLVLALALIHHMAIGNNVPLDRAAEFLAFLGRWLLIEFVPPADPMVRRMLALREDVFPEYNREGFERAFAERFSIERVEPLGDSLRSLYLMRRRDTGESAK